MRLESIRLRLILIAPLRLALSVGWLVAARAAGAHHGSAVLVFAVGALGTAFLAWNDPRARFQRPAGEPEPLPPDASVAPAWLHAYHAALPSTIGVSILAAIAIRSHPTLTALLAGILAGLGVVALLQLYGCERSLYLDPQRHLLFRK